MKFAIYLLAGFALQAQTSPVPQDPEKARFEGLVFNAVTNEPLRKAQLALHMNVAAVKDQRTAQPPQSTYTVTSDAAGHFEFANVEPGDYQLNVTRDGFAEVRLGNRGNGRKADPILLSRADRKTDFRIKMIPYGAISGVVLDEDGDPIRNLHISAMRYRYTSRGRELREIKGAESNDLGEFRIFDLPAGRYLIQVNPRLFRFGGGMDEKAYGAMFYPGVVQVASAIPQDLTPGQQLRGLTFNLRKTHVPTIRGKVVAPEGATRLEVGTLIVEEHGTNSSSSNIQDEKTGKFVLSGVGPGSIYITGSYVFNGQKCTTMIPVEAGTTDIDGLELRPLPPTDIAGQITVEGAPDFDTSRIGLTLDGASSGHMSDAPPSIAKDGRITIPGVLPGRYRVALSRMQQLYIKSIRWGTTDITDTELDLLAGVPPRTELSVVLGADAGELTGTVLSEKSEPVDSAMITLLPAGSRRSPTYFKVAATDPSGRFTIRGIAPGSYKVFAWDQVNANAVQFDPEFLKPFETAGQNLEILSKGKHTVELKLIVNPEPEEQSH